MFCNNNQNRSKSFMNRFSLHIPGDDTNEKLSSNEIDPIFKKECYQIAICQDGKFAVTFDTGKNSFNLEICVMIIIFY
jgi:hypothetical protein